MSEIEEEAVEARARVEESETEWNLSLTRCGCRRPVPSRCYFGRWLCALCGKVTGRRPRVRR